MDILWVKMHRKHAARVGSNVASIRPLGTAMKPYKYRVYFNNLCMNLPNEGFCKTLTDAKKLGAKLLMKGNVHYTCPECGAQVETENEICGGCMNIPGKG